MFCIDASVIVSAAHEGEFYSEQSKAFLEKIRRNEQKAFLPEIVIPEVASGLLRATERPDFILEFVHAIRFIPNFAFVALDNYLADLAAEVIAETGLRSADAIYVALALEYDLTLITLDKEQIKKSKELIAVEAP